MPTVANANSVIAPEPPPTVSATVLEGLSARFRPCGLYVMAARLDGTVIYRDTAAAAFFDKFAWPMIRHPENRDQMESLAANFRNTPLPVNLHNEIPGLLIAVVKHIEKRQPAFLLLLAAKDSSFALSEDILRAAGRAGLDFTWLAQQAVELPAYDAAALQSHVRLFQSVLRDQLRLAGIESELTSVSEQLAATYEELSLIYQVSGGMKINRSAYDFFMQTCLEVQQVMGTRGIGVALRADSQRREGPALHGAPDFPPELVAPLAEQLTRAVQLRRGPVLINDLNADRNFAWLVPHASRVLAVPLQRHEQGLGCLFALDKELGEFDSADSKLLTSIANESAIYLENSHLFEDMRGLMMGLLHSLTSAVDAKDTYTCGHSERVALLSRHIAQEIGLSDQDVEQIYMAGLLHDVGKIGVPESVLQKTGKLTPEEFEQMKKHPEIGARILQDVRQIQQIVPGVMHHHERYDGRGYPAGLAGEAIPLMGRIICLADCFDAMTTNRTYRRALPLEVAMAEIRRCAGTQFDPGIVEAFLRSAPELYRELLSDHQNKSKKLLSMPGILVASS